MRRHRTRFRPSILQSKKDRTTADPIPDKERRRLGTPGRDGNHEPTVSRIHKQLPRVYDSDPGIEWGTKEELSGLAQTKGVREPPGTHGLGVTLGVTDKE